MYHFKYNISNFINHNTKNDLFVNIMLISVLYPYNIIVSDCPVFLIRSVLFNS